MKHFMKRVFNEPEILETPEGTREARRLIKRMRRLPSQELYDHLAAFFKECNVIMKAIKKDPTSRRIRRDMKKLASDLMLVSVVYSIF